MIKTSFLLLACFCALSVAKRYYSESNIELHFPDNFSYSPKDRHFPPAFVLIGTIPDLDVEFRCQLVADRRLDKVPQVEIVGGELAGRDWKIDPCNYHGFATFSPPNNYTKTKCLVSLCRGFENGLIWLPSGDHLRFELDEKHTKAKFTAPINASNFLVDMKRFRQRRSDDDGDGGLPESIPDLAELLGGGLTQTPDLFHLRIAVLVSVESYNSAYFNKNTQAIVEFLSTSFALVNAIWSKMQVSVYLTRIIIWPSYDASPEVIAMPAEDWKDPKEILPRLRPLAVNHLWPRINDSADYIVVLRNMDHPVNTTVSVDGTPPEGIDAVIGVAMTRSMCRGKFAESPAWGAIMALVGTLRESKQQTLLDFASATAHELGHAMSLEHDDPTEEFGSCETLSTEFPLCVMNGFYNGTLTCYWSMLSQMSFAGFRNLIPPFCLKTLPPKNGGEIEVTGKGTEKGRSFCGNGIVEEGEQCDCGPKNMSKTVQEELLESAFCPNPKCCNPKTCRRPKGSKCAYGACCNLYTCDYHTDAKVCRKPRTLGCDIMEYCTGKSADCPEDNYMLTGTKCGIGQSEGTCYKGECVSRNQSCMQFFGSQHVPDEFNETCYSLNKEGLNATNCGHGPFRGGNTTTWYTPCNDTNKECGNLMCDLPSGGKNFPKYYYYVKTVYFGVRDGHCSMIASPVLPDYGHVPDGSLCNKGRGYCLNQQCVSPVPYCPFPPCDKTETPMKPDEFVQGYLGISKVTFRYAGEFKTSAKRFPSAMVLETQLPHSSVKFACHLSVNKRLNHVPFVEVAGENGTSKGDPCHYSGVSTITDHGTVFRTKGRCVVSFCSEVQLGVIWTPGKKDYLQFELNEDLTYARFLARSIQSKSDEKPDDVGPWVQQIVSDIYPPDWLHIRIAVLVSVEAFESQKLHNNKSATVNFLSSAFGVINAIWYPLKIAVHLTRVVIWPNYNASSEIFDMPASTIDMGDDYSFNINYPTKDEILKPLKTLAEQHLWPKIGASADYIVVLRNMDLPPPKPDSESRWNLPSVASEIRGASTAKTMCRGTMEIAPSHGAILSVSTVERKSSQHVVMDFATTVTHELGHAFGLRDDKTKACTCEATGQYSCIMSGKSESIREVLYWYWSNCSKADVKETRKKLPPRCLENIPQVPTADIPKGPPACGNGVVEENEECDCGPSNEPGPSMFCPNPHCCNMTRCTFPVGIGVRCAVGTCCDSMSCRFYPKTEVCRPAENEDCDLPELCTGSSPDCPEDRYLLAGTECGHEQTGNGDGNCYKKKCLSRNAQCRNLMGTGRHRTAEDEDCYSLNLLGGVTSNCGHGQFPSDANNMNKLLTACNSTKKDCGNLMCKPPANENKLPPRYRYMFRSTPRNDGKYQCASLAGPMLPDYGHVPDGLLCAKGAGYCLNFRCRVLPVCNKNHNPPCDNKGNHVDRPRPKPKPDTLGHAPPTKEMADLLAVIPFGMLFLGLTW